MTQRLAVHSTGPVGAPDVVLLHAIATSSAMWAMQVPILSRRFRVHAIDLPGYGASAGLDGRTDGLAGFADAVVATLDALDIRSAMIVGVSFGGMIAQRLAIDHSPRVRALVLAHCGARTTPIVSTLWDERWAAAEATGMPGQVNATLARWFTPAFQEASPQVMAWVSDMITQTPPDAYRASIRAIQQLDHVEALSQVRVPTLCIAGSADAATPVDAVKALAACVPGSALHVLDGAPHLAAIETPHAFTEAVLAFLCDRAPACESRGANSHTVP